MNAHDQKTQQQESRATADRRGSKSLSEQQGSKCTNQSCCKTTNQSRESCFIRSRMTSRPHRLKKTSRLASRNVAIYITRDYIWRQTKNLAFIFRHIERDKLFCICVVNTETIIHLSAVESDRYSPQHR